MSGLDDGYHDDEVETDAKERRNTPLSRPRRSMDMEFHDLNLDDTEDSDRTEPTSKRNSLDRNENSHNLHTDDWSSSDDDSFGEASDDCLPDHKYLEELLDDEYHPERLNLLHEYTPSQKKKKKLDEEDSPMRNGVVRPKYDLSDSDSEADRVIDTTDDDESYMTQGSSRSHGSVTSDSQQQHYEFDLSDHSDNEDNDPSENDGWIEGGTADSDTELETAAQDDEEDGFEGSPRRLPDPGRPTLKKQLESMGKSTKKSFRTVGKNSFFSQPFKGLSRSLSGSRRRKNKSVSLEQPEVA
ncbi:MAG: hypothetical protein SGILL_005695 [Bacillariaceae sp.]